MSDTILTEVILPIAEELLEKQLIQKWFFIRYADPKHHLRLRFLVEHGISVSEIMNPIFEALQPLSQQDIVWKVQLDTYNRELERYGANTIELSESLFHFDSIATTKFLSLIEGDEGERLRWLYGLRAIDTLVKVFGYTIAQKLQLLEDLKIGFGKEFNMSRPLKKQLDDKYRKERAGIDEFMSFTQQSNPDYQPILDILEQFTCTVSPIAEKLLEIERKNQLQLSKNQLLNSYIHMLMNRLFKSKNRLNEMVCYDFLYRFYKSVYARQKKEAKLMVNS
ncbi:hypothetical protein HCU67_02475 [Muricauda sp. DJ-13]|uniref:Thiopeptide-type bacteriocin biosynthesis domain-containing protein n=2 Tax=Croceivirga thetidis TaxID=2721623 RepID=A0ABX1GPT9_9FLAO|nr:hypothetical protein [Croceivirga thetidis]